MKKDKEFGVLIKGECNLQLVAKDKADAERLARIEFDDNNLLWTITKIKMRKAKLVREEN